MIPFLRRKKEEPIYLDCYTASHFAYDHAKIGHARKHIPDWFKHQRSFTAKGDASIKHCPAVGDYFAKGIVIPLWGEVEINVNPIGDETSNLAWRSSNTDFDLHGSSHPKSQWDEFGSDNLVNVKFVSPWAFKTREPLYFSWGQPLWSQPDTFNSLIGMPSVIQFKTQCATNLNYIVEQKAEHQTIKLEPLTPMAMLHPMTERRVEIRNHLVDADKFGRMLRRGGGMLLNDSVKEMLKAPKGFRAKKEKFWAKADELNKGPFK